MVDIEKRMKQKNYTRSEPLMRAGEENQPGSESEGVELLRIF